MRQICCGCGGVIFDAAPCPGCAELRAEVDRLNSENESLKEWGDEKAAEVERLRNEIARLNNQSCFACECGGTKVEVISLTAEVERLKGLGTALQQSLVDADKLARELCEQRDLAIRKLEAGIARCKERQNDGYPIGMFADELRAILEGE